MLFLGVLLPLFLHNAVAERHDGDLMSFQTLPEMRALKWDTKIHDPDRVTDGYWFVAPYGQISPEHPTQKYEQYQIGPYIYDNNGMLIWGGSPQFDNLNVFDFKANYNLDGEPHLSFILQRDFGGPGKGSGMILNNHYKVENKVGVVNDLNAFNMHEFNIMDGGKTALACTYRSQKKKLDDFDRPDEESFIVTGGFVELDIETSRIINEWDSFEPIKLTESNMFHKNDGPSDKPGYDYVHINAVDKNEAGDYIISMRFTNTIYMISGKDGSIMWRLGGPENDFEHDFTFSKQHDVKFIKSNGTNHVISFLNNASDERSNDEDTSSALIVEIDASDAMTAKVVKRINRPDHGLTRLRGSVQILDNDNIFVGWSERGYHTEHAPNGDMLMSGQFVSTRFSTYRAYKFPFVGRPLTPPDLVSAVYGTSDNDLTTIIHVSWNGATDVNSWKFYAQSYDNGDRVEIGHTKKTDFETMYIVDGFMDWVSAEAIDADGTVMGKSHVHRTKQPDNWKNAGWSGASKGASPDDPELIKQMQGSKPISNTEPTPSNSNSSPDTTAPPVDTTPIPDSSNSMPGMVNDGASMSHGNGGSGPSGSSYADAKEAAKAVYKAYEVIRGVGGFLIFVLVVCSVGGVLFGAYRVIRHRRRRNYHNIPTDEGLPMEEADNEPGYHEPGYNERYNEEEYTEGRE